MRIIKSAISITVLSGLSSILGVIQLMVIGYYFGVSRQMEMIFLSLSLYGTTQKLATSGALGEILLPKYIRELANSGRDRANLMASSIINITLLFSVVLVIISIVFANFMVDWFAPGFTAIEKKDIAIIFRIVSLLIITSTLSAMYRLIVNAHADFGMPELIGCLSSIVGLVVLIISVSYIGVYSYIASLFASNVVSLIFMVFRISRFGFRHRLIISTDKDTVDLIKASIPYYMYSLCIQLILYPTNALISLLPQGSYAIYNYVTRIYYQILSLIFPAFTIISSTKFAQDASGDTYENLSVSIGRAMRIYQVVVAYILGVILLISTQIVSVFLRGSQFTDFHIQLASYALFVAIWGFIFEGPANLLRKAAISVGKILPVVIVLVFANIAGLLYLWLVIGIAGIYGPVTMPIITTMITCILLYFYVRKVGIYDYFTLDSIRYIILSVSLSLVIKLIFWFSDINLAMMRMNIYISMVLYSLVFFSILTVILIRFLSSDDKVIFDSFVKNIVVRRFVIVKKFTQFHG